MNVDMSEIVEESIKLELNMAGIYNYFSIIFSDDTNFWQLLATEEQGHADLIKNGKNILLASDDFPHEILAPTLQDLIRSNKKLISLLKEFHDTAPSKESAFDIALYMEESAGEIHFQHAMETHPNSAILKIFQQLNSSDLNHAKRIREYRDPAGIS